MVRPPPARPDSPLHAEPPARRDRAGHAGRVHALPVRVAARRAGVQADRPRRAAGGARAARRRRAAGARVGARRAGGARRALRAGDARHAVPHRRGGWARLSTGPTQVVGATPIALFLREHADAWATLSGRLKPAPAIDEADPGASAAIDAGCSGLSSARCSITCAATAPPSRTSSRPACGLSDDDVRTRARRARRRRARQLRRLCRPAVDHRHRASSGPARVRSSDRGPLVCRAGSDPAPTRHRGQTPVHGVSRLRRSRRSRGRCCAATASSSGGVLAREAAGVPWRELARVYRRLEARGEIRGGRFVSGMSGEQFALPRRGGAPARSAPDAAGRPPRHDQRGRPAEPDRHHHAGRSHPRRRRQPHRLPQRRAAARRWKATCCGCWPTVDASIAADVAAAAAGPPRAGAQRLRGTALAACVSRR